MLKHTSITKEAIAKSLINLCKNKKFDKISISDITHDCGLNRQTFYYHFADKFELLNWIYFHMSFSELATGITLENWDNNLFKFLESIQNNDTFYTNTVKCEPQIFNNYLFELISVLFSELFEVLDAFNKNTLEQNTFHSRFFAYGSCGMINDWIISGMKTPAHQLVESVKYLAKDTEKLGYQLYKDTATQ